jgi:hypothetical protein
VLLGTTRGSRHRGRAACPARVMCVANGEDTCWCVAVMLMVRRRNTRMVASTTALHAGRTARGRRVGRCGAASTLIYEPGRVKRTCVRALAAHCTSPRAACMKRLPGSMVAATLLSVSVPHLLVWPMRSSSAFNKSYTSASLKGEKGEQGKN